MMDEMIRRTMPPDWAAVSGLWDAVHVAPSRLICTLRVLADTVDISLTCR